MIVIQHSIHTCVYYNSSFDKSQIFSSVGGRELAALSYTELSLLGCHWTKFEVDTYISTSKQLADFTTHNIDSSMLPSVTIQKY